MEFYFILSDSPYITSDNIFHKLVHLRHLKDLKIDITWWKIAENRGMWSETSKKQSI